MTREQIEQQLRLDNPTTTDDFGNRHGPGSQVYEAAIQCWADAMENAVKPPLPPAENYQVRAWMIRGGMDPDLVPAIIAQVVPEGPQRKEALMRWDYAVRIPRDFPLVDVIGGHM
jgi:hypothetical protein